MIKYSFEQKKALVTAYLNGEGGIRTVIKKYGYSNRSQLQRWIVAYQKRNGKTVSERNAYICEIVVILIAGCILIANKGTLKESTSYECYTYIESGQADDYKAQMEERLSLLRNPELKNVELPAMNSDQGPLMHMEVMEDPKEWTNTVVKQFFGKESVIEVPRSER